MVFQLLISKLMRAASGTVCLNCFYSKVYEGCLTQNKNNSDKTAHDLQLHQLWLEVEKPEWSTTFSFLSYFTQ